MMKTMTNPETDRKRGTAAGTARGSRGVGSRMIRASLAGLAGWSLLSVCAEEEKVLRVGEELRNSEYTTLQGESIQPLDAGSGPFAAVVFITTDCPIANAFSPELGRLADEAAELGGRLTLVHVDPGLAVEQARKHASDYRLPENVVLDRKHRLVGATGAQITPEAVLVDAEGRIRYRGRINDLFTDYGDRRRHVAHHDFRDAMRALANGEAPSNQRTEAIGCFIPDLPESSG